MTLSHSSLFMALCLACSPVIADRPAMSDRGDGYSPYGGGETVQMESVDRPAMQSMQAPAPQPVMTETVQQTTGDVLEMQPGETLNIKLLNFPRRGMDMSRVQNELGEPLVISPTVGEPPITTWSYADRKVYFEGSTVIHVVATN